MPYLLSMLFPNGLLAKKNLKLSGISTVISLVFVTCLPFIVLLIKSVNA